jgi:addiction module HigA family antidote
MTNELSTPVHPGEILHEDLMKPLGLTREKLAEALSVETELIDSVIMGDSPITAEFAMRLSRYFGGSPEMWMNLQSRYELETAKDTMAAEIKRTIRPRSETRDAAPA